MLNERTLRLWAAAEAEAVGRCGIAMVARATGMSRTRIARGIEELRSEDRLEPGRTRRADGGRKRIVDTDPTLISDLNALLEPIIAGKPDDSPLRWTSKSVSKLTAELQAVGRRVVNELLHHLGYPLQANRKSTEEPQHPDRDAQQTSTDPPTVTTSAARAARCRAPARTCRGACRWPTRSKLGSCRSQSASSWSRQALAQQQQAGPQQVGQSTMPVRSMISRSSSAPVSALR